MSKPIKDGLTNLQRLRARRRQASLCLACGKPVVSKTLCKVCMDKQTERTRKLIAKWKEAFKKYVKA